MKKLLTIFSAVALMTMVACGSKTEDKKCADSACDTAAVEAACGEKKECGEKKDSTCQKSCEEKAECHKADKAECAE